MNNGLPAFLVNTGGFAGGFTTPGLAGSGDSSPRLVLPVVAVFGSLVIALILIIPVGSRSVSDWVNESIPRTYVDDKGRSEESEKSDNMAVFFQQAGKPVEDGSGLSPRAVGPVSASADNSHIKVVEPRALGFSRPSALTRADQKKLEV